MTLTDWSTLLGGFGDFIASLAVVVTVIILIVQIRHARAEMSLAAQREIKMHNNETFHQMIDNVDLLDIHIRGQRDFASLSEEEKVRWQIWVFTWIVETEIGYVARRDGTPGMHWIERYMNGVAAMLKSEGGQIVWPRMRPFFEEDFAVAIEQRTKQVKLTWLDILTQ